MRILAAAFLMIVVLTFAGVGGLLYGFYYFGKDLPEYQKLADYNPPTVTRIHAGDGRLMAEFAREKRVFVPISAMPKRVIEAFLSSEDKTFYTHWGIDLPGILRATLTNLRRINTDRRPIGASTITQQVAKNFLLTNEVSIARKVKEVILALRIERAFSKEKILELYLNEIYLGFGSYGVAAAALNYFDKSLDDLTLAEAAFLAGLPKAPNNYHPIRKPAAARARRNYVLNRMAENGYISIKAVSAEMADSVDVRPPGGADAARADYFVEEVRRELQDAYGDRGLYGGGLSVRTTLDSRLQKIADTSLRLGLSAYDRRHGWRGPLGQIDIRPGWHSELSRHALPEDVEQWKTAVVLSLSNTSAKIGFSDKSSGILPLKGMNWARRFDEKDQPGPAPKLPRDVLSLGDVIAVESVAKENNKDPSNLDIYALRQIPQISGAIVVLDPHTGRVLAMSGGFSAELSQFNRVTQAFRQPGSAFKPFVYLAALDKGFTPSSQILDAPFVIDQGPGLGRWRPGNYTKKFYGASPLRIGIEKSRNLMTVRLAQNIGMETVVDYAKRFNVIDDLKPMLSMSLGASETTLMRMTTAYAMLVNGGKRIQPTLIDKIQNRTGKTIFRHDDRRCVGCDEIAWEDEDLPQLPDNREQIADPRTAYQLVSMLEGVVKRGTGRRINIIGKPLAGKTGTTNESRDTWFVGFSPDLAVGVYVGFDTPKPLGKRETGSSVAAPIFKSFMEAALSNKPAIPFRIPPGLELVRVDYRTGKPVRSGRRGVILEAFLPGTIPTGTGKVLDGSGGEFQNGNRGVTPTRKLRGLY
ncbi:MAG: Penicillin-binding protein 1A [Alphaproteobacteria bacterium MarineAlpha11_Bin1]|nr:MAG: Penicillin-binding protein 1A [Alphaproteobacteria bacterium MarineAlpha11_Bin1]|tara:strand:+ start:10197 stop:12626 length:2430 start_codon:yes stop_codon:yes gene_type:complete